MDTEKYNGYTNYATWNWTLWLDNDEGSYAYWRELAEEHSEQELAEMLEAEADEWVGENLPEASPFTDIMRHAIANINWREVAETRIETTND